MAMLRRQPDLAAVLPMYIGSTGWPRRYRQWSQSVVSVSGTLISIVADTALKGRGVRVPYTHVSGCRGAIGRLADDRSGTRRRHRYRQAQSESTDIAAATQNWTIRMPSP
ncbi:hypothetical protein BZM27_24230 [Paraburkholderia steynii]|uniref:Uncharacterized protein n=1 Tax=Paraburkholderia steynii TaxID=1245441 RepID=A0A4R0XFV4_9BURK|nr:hypothetical protein BZM27_24230 [Paraburkholderia steynii]